MEPQVPKRVLHVVSSMGRGGAETLIMNVYRNMDRSLCQFDFITHSSGVGDYDEEIRNLGGRIYQIQSLGEIGPFRYVKDLKRMMSNGEYTAVHAHTDYQSGFPALAAKLSGIQTRICHSHSSSWLKSGKREELALKVLKSLIRLSATKYCSCSEEAAAFLFGKKRKKEVQILHNSIEVNEYVNTDSNLKMMMHQTLNIPDHAKIIGHVGRFSDSKNQQFILNVLKSLLVEGPDYYAVFVGDGPLRQRIESKAEELGVGENVKFLGIRTDIPQLMNGFDIFIFPSLFEGFGIVLLEAQCAGVPCIAADSVPKSTDMGLGLTKYLSLHSSIEQWCKEIKSSLSVSKPSKDEIRQQFTNKGFHIENVLQDWMQLYDVG
ncbi:glycosyltransferase EpsF [Cytobacillus purgationiresistens]|uniref:Glycosyltransferase EpsF n=2 Tax=Cytobacillus purgationiresistens TaxID=863449 RepID=A0ABU0AI46_9BACI|nr:glycosyltransferase EpsF [Cytobacillus purgationiresistens]